MFGFKKNKEKAPQLFKAGDPVKVYANPKPVCPVHDESTHAEAAAWRKSDAAKAFHAALEKWREGPFLNWPGAAISHMNGQRRAVVTWTVGGVKHIEMVDTARLILRAE